METLDILAIGAHPDDVEIGAAGALIKAAQAGRRVAIVDLTFAELSSNGSVERRQREAAEASRLLGLVMRENFGLPDRGLESAREEAIIRLVDVIRETRPSILLAPYWQDRHPDHEAACRLVKEACFSAGIGKFAGGKHLPPHRPARLYHYFINTVTVPGLVVDVSDIYRKKMDVLRCYRSQFEREENSVVTPLNNGYLEAVEARERLFGQQAGVQFAEGFVTASPPVFDSLH